MAEVKTISTEELQQRLEQDNSLHLWNVLTDGYFTGEMIPGSRRVPLDTIGRKVSEAKSPRDEEIIVYCGGPKCPQSLQAAQKLMDLTRRNPTQRSTAQFQLPMVRVCRRKVPRHLKSLDTRTSGYSRLKVLKQFTLISC